MEKLKNTNFINMLKQRTPVWLKGDRTRPGMVCAIQKNLYDKSEPTRYWVLWRDLKKSDHEEDQLEIRK